MLSIRICTVDKDKDMGLGWTGLDWATEDPMEKDGVSGCSRPGDSCFLCFLSGRSLAWALPIRRSSQQDAYRECLALQLHGCRGVRSAKVEREYMNVMIAGFVIGDDLLHGVCLWRMLCWGEREGDAHATAAATAISGRPQTSSRVLNRSSSASCGASGIFSLERSPSRVANPQPNLLVLYLVCTVFVLTLCAVNDADPFNRGCMMLAAFPRQAVLLQFMLWNKMKTGPRHILEKFDMFAMRSVMAQNSSMALAV